MAASTLERGTATDTSTARPAARRPSFSPAGAARRIGAWVRRPGERQLVVLAAVLIAGVGALVWHFAGGGADGAIVAGIVAGGLAVLVGSYASVFVTRGQR